jgi:hypothetical protein
VPDEPPAPDALPIVVELRDETPLGAQAPAGIPRVDSEQDAIPVEAPAGIHCGGTEPGAIPRAAPELHTALFSVKEPDGVLAVVRF